MFLDNYRRRPEKLLPLEDVVVVLTKGSVFYVFDSQSAHILQKFDVSPITQYLGKLLEAHYIILRLHFPCKQSCLSILMQVCVS